MRVRLELGLAFYLKQERRPCPRAFRAGPWWGGRRPGPWSENVTRNFLSIMRGRRRWRGYFGFSVAPDTNINAASDAEIIYINGLPFRRDALVSGPVRISAWWAGAGLNTSIPLAERWRLRYGVRLSTTGNIKGRHFDQTFRRDLCGGRAGCLAGTTEMSLLATASQRWWGGQYSFNYDYRRAPGSAAPGLRRACRLSGAGHCGSDRIIPAAEVAWTGSLMRVFPGRELRALSRPCRSTPWWVIQLAGLRKRAELG